jgi:hypothetical protein
MAAAAAAAAAAVATVAADGAGGGMAIGSARRSFDKSTCAAGGNRKCAAVGMAGSAATVASGSLCWRIVLRVLWYCDKG